MVNICIIFGIDDEPVKTKTKKLFAKLMTINLRAFLNSLIETDLPPPPPEGLQNRINSTRRLSHFTNTFLWINVRARRQINSSFRIYS